MQGRGTPTDLPPRSGVIRSRTIVRVDADSSTDGGAHTLTEEWFRTRGPLAQAVVAEMKAAGVYVFAGGLEEDGPVYSADPTSGTMPITDGPYVETKEFLGGFALVDVADDEAATMWAAKVAQACGWPHEVRRFGPQPDAE
jgi:hypothetical protein